MLLEITRENYHFDNWRKTSKFHDSNRKIMFNHELIADFYLHHRDSVGLSNAYKDTYVSVEDERKRVSMTVINADSFEAAKEELITHLAQCAANNIPALSEDDMDFDIGYGGFSDIMCAASFVHGNTFIHVASIGEETIDIAPLLAWLNAEIAKP